MRSIPISMAILGFCVTAPIFGCFWSWFITLQYSVKTINFVTWFVFNSVCYVGIASFFHLYTVRLSNRKWESTVHQSMLMIGVALLITATLSIYAAYKVAVETRSYSNPEVGGFDVMALMLIGIIGGILIGLSILTLGYCWIAKDKRKRKV